MHTKPLAFALSLFISLPLIVFLTQTNQLEIHIYNALLINTYLLLIIFYI